MLWSSWDRTEPPLRWVEQCHPTVHALPGPQGGTICGHGAIADVVTYDEVLQEETGLLTLGCSHIKLASIRKGHRQREEGHVRTDAEMEFCCCKPRSARGAGHTGAWEGGEGASPAGTGRQPLDIRTQNPERVGPPLLLR